MNEEWISREELLTLLALERKGRPLREFARALGGVPFQLLGMVLAGRKPPGLAIPEAVGYEPVIVYRRIRSKRAGTPCTPASSKPAPR